MLVDRFVDAVDRRAASAVPLACSRTSEFLRISEYSKKGSIKKEL